MSDTLGIWAVAVFVLVLAAGLLPMWPKPMSVRLIALGLACLGFVAFIAVTERPARHLDPLISLSLSPVLLATVTFGITRLLAKRRDAFVVYLTAIAIAFGAIWVSAVGSMVYMCGLRGVCP